MVISFPVGATAAPAGGTTALDAGAAVDAPAPVGFAGGVAAARGEQRQHEQR